MRKKTILGNYRDPWTSEKEQGWHIVVLARTIFTTAPTTAQASVPRRVNRPICSHCRTVIIIFLSSILRLRPPLDPLLKLAKDLETSMSGKFKKRFFLRRNPKLPLYKIITLTTWVLKTFFARQK